MEVLPWYIAGPLLGITIPILLVLNEKQLGVSSSLRAAGSFIYPRLDYFKYDSSKDLWQVYFVVGVIAASITLNQLQLIQDPVLIGSVPDAASIYSVDNWIQFLSGGVLIGFGARYAGGCTAGHCLMGNASLAPSSLVSTIAFFVGGLIVSHFVLPNIL
jgi:uncharacterized membrane protein YedE/YeeE